MDCDYSQYFYFSIMHFVPVVSIVSISVSIIQMGKSRHMNMNFSCEKLVSLRDLTKRKCAPV